MKIICLEYIKCEVAQSLVKINQQTESFLGWNRPHLKEKVKSRRWIENSCYEDLHSGDIPSEQKLLEKGKGGHNSLFLSHLIFSELNPAQPVSAQSICASAEWGDREKLMVDAQPRGW